MTKKSHFGLDFACRIRSVRRKLLFAFCQYVNVIQRPLAVAVGFIILFDLNRFRTCTEAIVWLGHFPFLCLACLNLPSTHRRSIQIIKSNKCVLYIHHIVMSWISFIHNESPKTKLWKNERRKSNAAKCILIHFIVRSLLLILLPFPFWDNQIIRLKENK